MGFLLVFFSILLQISGLKHNPGAAAFISLVLECLSSIHKHLVNFSAWLCSLSCQVADDYKQLKN